MTSTHTLYIKSQTNTYKHHKQIHTYKKYIRKINIHCRHSHTYITNIYIHTSQTYTYITNIYIYNNKHIYNYTYTHHKHTHTSQLPLIVSCLIAILLRGSNYLEDLSVSRLLQGISISHILPSGTCFLHGSDLHLVGGFYSLTYRPRSCIHPDLNLGLILHPSFIHHLLVPPPPPSPST